MPSSPTKWKGLAHSYETKITKNNPLISISTFWFNSFDMKKGVLAGVGQEEHR